MRGCRNLSSAGIAPYRTADLFATGRRSKRRRGGVIYAALDTKTANDLAAAFKQATGLDAEVALQIEQAGTVSSRIKTEAASPRADVVIGGNSNFHTDLAAGGFLQRVPLPRRREGGHRQEVHGSRRLLDGLVPRALCILYNNKRYQDEIAPKGIAAPATWDDC